MASGSAYNRTTHYYGRNSSTLRNKVRAAATSAKKRSSGYKRKSWDDYMNDDYLPF